MRRNRGITLIALVITIIILLILSGVTLVIVGGDNGLINHAKNAKKEAKIGEITDALNIYGVNAQANKQGDIDISEYLNYIQTKGDYSVQVEDTEDNTETSKYILVDDIYEYLIEETDKKDIIITYQGTIDEIDGIKLSSYRGEYTYPESGSFRIIKNVTEGELSVTTNNSEIATASIEGKVVTVTPGTLAGEAIITIKAAARGKYQEKTATYTAVVENGNIIVIAEEYNGIYDTTGHGITVTTEPAEAIIEYSTDGENYSSTNPIFTDVGDYTVYYKVSLTGYKTVSGSRTVTIEKDTDTSGLVELSATSGEVTYPNVGTFNVTKNVSNGVLNVVSQNPEIAKASIRGNTVTIEPMAVNVESTATITVISGETNNYHEAKANYTVTVKLGSIQITANEYNGTYDGSGHGITVTTNPADAIIKYSEDGVTYNLNEAPRYTDVSSHTTYYKVSRDGYKTVAGSKTVTITKVTSTNNSLLQLSEASGTIIYPNTKTFTVTSNTSGGSLSVSSSNDNIATVNISGTTVTIHSGTTAGQVIITVTSAATTNYEAQTATYSATIVEGTIIVTADEYNGTYDGSGHGITVSSNPADAEIKYSTDGINYNLNEAPRYTDASTHTTYYKVSKAGYKTVSGSKKVTITKVNSTNNSLLQLSEYSGSVIAPNTKTFTVTKNTSGGSLSVSSSNTNIATATISGTTVTVSAGTIDGTTKIIVTSAATGNYEAQTAEYTIAATAHKHSYSTYVSTTATCTSAGYDTYKCSCGDTTTYSRAALGHNYQATGTVSATCTSGGYTNYKCSRCNGTTTGNATSSLGHDWYETSRTSASCTSGGTIYYRCRRCSATTTGSNGSATGHSYTWVRTTNPSCTLAGTDTYRCSTCGATNGTRSVSALGHDWTCVSTTMPNCTQPGSHGYKCNRCGATKSESYGSAMGHSYDWVITTNATCTTAGTETYRCNTCGATNGTRSIAALGHSWGLWYISGSQQSRTCSRCGAKETINLTKCSKCNGSGKVTCTSTNLKTNPHNWTCPYHNISCPRKWI